VSDVLEVHNVWKRYPGDPPVESLRDVSLTIREGELVAIVGPSGSGKTTLLHVMGTLDRPTQGDVRVAGHAASGLSDVELSGLRGKVAGSEGFVPWVERFIGIRAGLGFFGVRPVLAVGAGLAVVFAAMTTGRYWTWERITMGLAIFNGLFVPAALLAHPDWSAVGHSLLTWSPLPHGKAFDILLLVLADIGATVTPWMTSFTSSRLVTGYANAGGGWA